MYIGLTCVAFCVQWLALTLAAAAENLPCSSKQITCLDGSCVSFTALCDGKADCVDGRDEAVCETTPRPIMCVSPAYPKHGAYTVINVPDALPGQDFESLQLTVTCHTGYQVDGPNIVFCLKGVWYGSMPQCKPACKLDKDPSVHYHCLVPGSQNTRICNEYETTGTVVRPECNTPNYYSTNSLPSMRCANGTWNEVVTCIPECGKATIQEAEDARSTKKGELPWHATIYSKASQPYEFLCGGALVSTTVVLSTARCFWNKEERIPFPAARYAVAVGKNYQTWGFNLDSDAQHSDVIDIKVPRHFKGDYTYLQASIAVVVVATPFVYNLYVRPVCLNFDVNLDSWQLQPGRIGKVPSWSPTLVDGQQIHQLTVLTPPYLDLDFCYRAVPRNSSLYITIDKFCAAYSNGSVETCSILMGGSGIVFPQMEQGVERFYLRGLTAVQLKVSDPCNATDIVLYTHVLDHERFIKKNLARGFCKLAEHPSVHYRCLVPGSNATRNCNAYEPSGTVVRPECNMPKYHSTDTILPTMKCTNGKWNEIVTCSPGFCKLESHPSVRYYCLVTGSVVRTRRCNAYEPSGTVVRPECNAPNYYSTVSPPSMTCNNGIWNEVFTCVPECGRVTSEAVTPFLGSRPAKRGELPWHAGIYAKTFKPYKQICGGSLVRPTVVISAAHCFWTAETKQLPSTNFAVAVGKLYQPWNDDKDQDAQHSDVSAIHLPVHFEGSTANFKDDIAVVVTATPFEYKTHVRPVCLSFDTTFERWQLQPGSVGKVAGWGPAATNGLESPVLLATRLPYVDINQCYRDSPPDFKEYVTSDKICAGYTNGSTLCEGDSGGGLSFPELEQGKERYYLRGIVSTAPSPEGQDKCNAHAYVTFTKVLKHDPFIQSHL